MSAPFARPPAASLVRTPGAYGASVPPSASPSDTTNTSDALNAAHGEYLAARAVPLDRATAAGLRSVTREEGALLLSRATPLESGAMAIPYPGIEPAYTRLRMDAGAARYLAPASREVPIYVTSAATKPKSALYVVESPIKALALAAIGLSAIGLGGTGTTLTKGEHRALNVSWGAVPLKGRHVTIVFDANRATNANVARDEARLARALTEAGASVRVARLPRSEDGREWGPDDYLAAKGAKALKTVLATAVAADPVDRATEAGKKGVKYRVAAMNALLDDLPFIVAVLERGVSTLATVRESFGAVKAAKAFDQAIRLAKAAAKEAALRAASEQPGVYVSDYCVHQGRLCQIVYKDDVKKFVPLANFEAAILREVLNDDGAEQRLSFEIGGKLASGEALPTISVPADEFAEGDWPLTRWGARAVVEAGRGIRDHLRAAIQTLSTPQQVKSFAHTGWVEIAGKRVFLHAGGAIGAESVAVNLDGPLARYRLPDVTEGPYDAARVAWRALDITRNDVSLVLVCAIFRAVLADIVRCDAVIWVCGPTGSFKTTLIGLLLNFVGKFDRLAMPASWNDTAASLETKLHRLKDLPVVIDDFAPRSSDDYDETRRKASQIVRSVGNQASRSRMWADGSARPDRPPRGFVIVTGEDLPSGESVLGRILPVRLSRDSVDLDVLTELQGQAGRLAHAGRAFIEMVAREYEGIREWMPGRIAEWVAKFTRETAHPRAAMAAADIAIGGDLFAGFAENMKVIDAAGAVVLRERIFRALSAHMGEQAVAAVERTPTDRFMRWLRALLAQGRAKLGSSPSSQPDAMGGEHFIGWRVPTRGVVWLLPEATFSAVASAMKTAGESMPVVASSLWRHLSEAGILTPSDEEGRHTVKRSAAGTRMRLLEMHVSAIDDMSGPDGGGGVPPSPACPASGADLGTPASAETRSPIAPQSGGCPNCPSLEGVPPTKAPASRTADDARDDVAGAPPPPGGTGTSGTPGFQFPARAPASSAISMTYEIVVDAEALSHMAGAVSQAGIVALDTETTGLDPLRDRVRLVQIRLPDGPTYVIDVLATGGLGPVAQALGGVGWVGHNLHFDLAMLRAQFGVVPHGVFDTMLASQMIDGGVHLHEKGYHRLAPVCHRTLGVEVDKAEQQSDWSGTLTPAQLEYAARDVQHLFALAKALERQLVADGLERAAEIEFEVLPVVVDMQLAGVPIDLDRWRVLTEAQARLASEARSRVECALAIKNANSSLQLAPALSTRLGVKLQSTSAETLAKYKSDPVVADLQAFRSAQSFLTSHAQPIISALAQSLDGRIRAHWRQLAAPTGRMACSDPPLLNLPKGLAEVRACIAAPPGHVLIVADYSAIELRILAQITGDERLTKVFADRGDPHRTTAAALLGKAESEVTSAERGRVKAVNFGFCYGMGADRFVAYALTNYGAVYTADEARRFRKAYFQAYRGVHRWQKRVGHSMDLVVRTLGGRLRRFADQRDGYSERLNTPVQGTGADGLKRAMILAHPRLSAVGARIVLAVHDELVVVAPDQHAAEAKSIVETSMHDGMAEFLVSVPVVVEAKVCRTWAEKD